MTTDPSTTSSGADWRWIDAATIGVPGATIRVDHTPAIYDFVPAPDRFLMVKTRAMLDRYVERLRGVRVRNLLELGTYRGGGCIFLYHLLHPAKLVTLDAHPNRFPALDEYVAAQGLGSKIVPHWGVDQSDRAALEAVLAESFGDALLDLVVDDASHLYRQSLASFNILFPRLRPGGWYVLEDWGWAHWPMEKQVHRFGYRTEPHALTNLVFRMVLLAASRPDLIEELVIDDVMAWARRGPGAVDPTGFDLDRLYDARGRPLDLI